MVDKPNRKPTEEELNKMYRERFGIINLTKDGLGELLKKHYNVKDVAFVTCFIGDEYATQIDDSNRPLDLCLKVEEN